MAEFLGALISLLMIVAVIAGFIAYPEEIFKFSTQAIVFIIMVSISIPIIWITLKAVLIGLVKTKEIIFKCLVKIKEVALTPFKYIINVLDIIFSKKATTILLYIFLCVVFGFYFFGFFD